MAHGHPPRNVVGAVESMRKEHSRCGRVALVGRPNVGKSTLLNGLLGESIAITSPHPQTTRDPILGVLTRGPSQFIFVDTPGVHAARHRLGEQMNAASMEAAAQADVVVLVLDAAAALNAAGVQKSDGPGGGTLPAGVPASALEADAAVIAHVSPRTPIVCALNKIDRVSHKALLLPLLERIAATVTFAAIVPLSAKHADGMDRLLTEVEKLLPDGPHGFGADELSDRPVRFFVAEFVREQVLRQTREEVPHGVAVTVERFDEAPNVPRICVTVHVDKESHKPIVIGKGGATLKAIGVEARARTEALLGKQVHLEIRVRVTPHWYENETLLRDFGYGPPPKAGSPSRSGGGGTQ